MLNIPISNYAGTRPQTPEQSTPGLMFNVPGFMPAQLPQRNMAGGVGSLFDSLGDLGVGMMAASGPSRMPMNLGQVLAGGMGFMNQQQEAVNKGQMNQLAMTQARNQMGSENQLRDALQQIAPGLQSGQITPQQASGLLAPYMGAANPSSLPQMLQATSTLNPLLKMGLQNQMKLEQQKQQNQMKIQGAVDTKRIQAIDEQAQVVPMLRERAQTMQDLVDQTPAEFFGPTASKVSPQFSSNIQQINEIAREINSLERKYFAIPASGFGVGVMNMLQESGVGTNLKKDALQRIIGSKQLGIDGNLYPMLDQTQDLQRYTRDYLSQHGDLSGFDEKLQKDYPHMTKSNLKKANNEAKQIENEGQMPQSPLQNNINQAVNPGKTFNYMDWAK